jgi:hypothetical protein
MLPYLRDVAGQVHPLYLVGSYALFGIINFIAILTIWIQRETYEDILMRSDTYIPSRLQWLKVSIRAFCHYPPTDPHTRAFKVEKICKRYGVVEDLLKRYHAWEEKITRSTAIRDWDEKREFQREVGVLLETKIWAPLSEVSAVMGCICCVNPPPPGRENLRYLKHFLIKFSFDHLP